jgi:hypothetical protein
MQFGNRKRRESPRVIGPWPGQDMLGSTGAGHQPDDLHGFYRSNDGSPSSSWDSFSDSRPKRPIRIVARRRGTERASLFESARNGVRRIPTAWRVVAGLIVLLSALELYMVIQSSAAQSGQEAISAISRDATIVQDELRGPPIIAPAG